MLGMKVMFTPNIWVIQFLCPIPRPHCPRSSFRRRSPSCSTSILHSHATGNDGRRCSYPSIASQFNDALHALFHFVLDTASRYSIVSLECVNMLDEAGDVTICRRLMLAFEFLFPSAVVDST